MASHTSPPTKPLHLQFDSTSFDAETFSPAAAEAVLLRLAGTFSSDSIGLASPPPAFANVASWQTLDVGTTPALEARYRALVEQIPAIVFMAYLDRGIGEAYVSPQIEATLGFSQQEWLEDPVVWYRQLHPDDKERWSAEAAQMFLTGRPLRSVYRVLARDGKVVWFHSEANMVRQVDGRPWFIHGVAFDVSELKQVETALVEERNVLSAILDTVGALVVVLDPEGRIVRFNRACELTTGYSFEEVKNRYIWELFSIPEELESVQAVLAKLRTGQIPDRYETYWVTRQNSRRRIAWSTTLLARNDGSAKHIIVTGIDVTERERLQKTILEVSGREQRRIGQDLHDGLGQHLTGIAFMTKVLEQKLAEKNLPESADAQKIMKLVNEAIHKTRELSSGLLPVVSDAHGLMSALSRLSNEVEDVFHVSCRFQCERQVLMNDVNAATHLYHIAQEAVNNAIKHGQAKHIAMVLSTDNGSGVLTIRDDGVGFRVTPAGGPGMGLHIMRYRANMIGGMLQVGKNSEGWTSIDCLFPAKMKEESD